MKYVILLGDAYGDAELRAAGYCVLAAFGEAARASEVVSVGGSEIHAIAIGAASTRISVLAILRGVRQVGNPEAQVFKDMPSPDDIRESRGATLAEAIEQAEHPQLHASLRQRNDWGRVWNRIPSDEQGERVWQESPFWDRGREGRWISESPEPLPQGGC